MYINISFGFTFTRFACCLPWFSPSRLTLLQILIVSLLASFSKTSFALALVCQQNQHRDNPFAWLYRFAFPSLLLLVCCAIGMEIPSKYPWGQNHIFFLLFVDVVLFSFLLKSSSFVGLKPYYRVNKYYERDPIAFMREYFVARILIKFSKLVSFGVEVKPQNLLNVFKRCFYYRRV